MSDGSSIEWLTYPGYKPASWNPTRGCTNVSEGCRRCYARVMAARFSQPGQWGHGFADMRGGDHRWTGRVELIDGRLLEPLRWKKPRCIFVNSTSDLFHEKLSDEAIDRVFAVMALCPQHLFIVLTKRAERMRQYLLRETNRLHWENSAVKVCNSPCAAHAIDDAEFPLPNVILGVSVEDQATADERIPHLLATPAACRAVSAEPLLGPIDFRPWLVEGWRGALSSYRDKDDGIRRADIDGKLCDGIDWVIVGSESGHGARPCDIGWVRSVRDQCGDDGVAFFWKQHIKGGRKISAPELDGRTWTEFPQITV